MNANEIKAHAVQERIAQALEKANDLKRVELELKKNEMVGDMVRHFTTVQFNRLLNKDDENKLGEILNEDIEKIKEFKIP